MVYLSAKATRGQIAFVKGHGQMDVLGLDTQSSARFPPRILPGLLNCSSNYFVQDSSIYCTLFLWYVCLVYFLIPLDLMPN